MLKVVSDTTPIICLLKFSRLDILKDKHLNKYNIDILW